MSLAVLTTQPASVEWAAYPQARFPDAAQVAGVTEGRVRLSCDASDGGILSNCVVLDEQPQGLGFADAALESIPRARLQPRPAGEQRPTVTFTVGFLLQDDSSPRGEGDVTLDCERLQDGSLRDCRIVRERPEARGLGNYLIANPQFLRAGEVPDWIPGQRTTITVGRNAP